MARILLVDDDIAEISAVKRVLMRGGHQTLLATNAKDAISFVARGAPNLVLVASECEGGEALRALAGDGGVRALPLVVLGETADGPSGAARVARPIDPEQLADQVKASLSVREPKAARPSIAARVPVSRPAARTKEASADAASARRAAADALRARAEELRRGPAAAGSPSVLPTPAPTAQEPADPGLEAILRRAEEAERARAAERSARVRQADRATVEAAQRAEAERVAVEKAARARAAERRARTEERARADAERMASDKAEQARAAEERARAEQRARAEAERIASDRSKRARAAEERARAEQRARAEAERMASDKAEQARAAEERARAEQRARAQAERRAREEAEARARLESERREAEKQARQVEEAEETARAAAQRDAEEQLEQLRVQLDEERRSAEQRIESVKKRAEAEELAAEELRRMAEEEAQRRAEEEGQRRAQAEEELRSTIASAHAEMEVLRRRTEEESRRRAEAEAEVTRVAAEAKRRAAEAKAEAARLAAEAARRAAEAAARAAPFDLPVYRPPDDELEPDPAEEAPRRRVTSLRERAVPPRERAPPPDPEPQPDPPPAERPLRVPPRELRGGTVEDLPVPRLLAVAARAEVTGRMDFEGDAARSIHFEDGLVVGATSADPAERVEELALRLGLVTRDQHRQIGVAAASLASRRAALLLLERGFLKPTELTPLVRRRTEEVLFGVFADPAARFRWAAVEVPADERIALERSTLALAVEGVRRRWRADRVDAVLGGAGTLLSPVPAGPSPDDLGLSPGERRAVALADGLRTIDEIVAANPLDALSARQVLAALVLVGTLAVRMFQGGRPVAAAAAAIDLARVRDKLDQVRRADYFTILGVARLSTPHEIREAADRLLAEFDPVRYQGVREDGLAVRLAEIQRVVADAKDVLADERLRDEYVNGLGD